MKGTVSPPERCDFTSSQQYNNNVLLRIIGWGWAGYRNYLDRGQRYLPKPKAEADNADRGLNNSDILRKPNSIIRLLFILQEKSAM